MIVLGLFTGKIRDPPLDDVSKRRAGDEPHRHAVKSVDLGELRGGQVRPPREPHSALGLAAELCHSSRIVRQLGLQDLERDQLTERPESLRFPHFALAPLPQPLEKPIRPELATRLQDRRMPFGSNADGLWTASSPRSHRLGLSFLPGVIASSENMNLDPLEIARICAPASSTRLVGAHDGRMRACVAARVSRRRSR